MISHRVTPMRTTRAKELFRDQTVALRDVTPKLGRRWAMAPLHSPVEKRQWQRTKGIRVATGWQIQVDIGPVKFDEHSHKNRSDATETPRSTIQ